MGGHHLDEEPLEIMNKTLLTVGLALVASVTYAGPKSQSNRRAPRALRAALLPPVVATVAARRA